VDKPVFRPDMTYGEKYGYAMEITDEGEAAAYFEQCVQHTMSFGHSREEAEKVERANLGYWAGYYDRQTALRVFRLFGAVHPIFGMSQPSAEEALEAGKRLAKSSSDEKE